MPSQQWQERVKRAQQMAAERLGVDVSVMKPPRQPSGEGAEAAAPAAEAQPAQAAAAAAPASKAAAAPEVPKPVAPASVALSPAARRIAEAKARAAAKSNGNGAVAAAAVPQARTAAPTVRPTAEPAEEEAEEEVGQEGINRREFLSYAWGAALGLLTLEVGAATYFFMYPRFRAGEFGGKFFIGPASELPSADAAPDGNTTGKFWLVETEEGPKALYMVCTHLGCLYKWEASNFRFECPCHGSKFSHDGYYIEGPAPRSLDQFLIEIVENGQVVSQTEDAGDEIVPPVIPSPEATIVVDTGRRILGKPAEASPARATT